MTAIVFNSVPQEDIAQRWGCDADRARVKGAISEMRRYMARQLGEDAAGADSFEAEDLLQLRNVPKVTRCLAQLAKAVSSVYIAYLEQQQHLTHCILSEGNGNQQQHLAVHNGHQLHEQQQ